MPTKIEKDAVTGRETTGHEWDGLRELNTPLPKWWIYTWLACIAWAIGYCVLYPSVPYGTGYYHGLLGYSSRTHVAHEVAEVAAERDVYMKRIAAAPFAAILKDPQLMQVAETVGAITFAENCAPCHGQGGAGRIGYPALAAGAWIWGGTLPEIQQTVTDGIRSADPDARQSQMPPFGTSGMLSPAQIQSVADFVWSRFYGHVTPGQDVSPGAKIFAANCAVCHGDAGQGNRAVGAPRLASRVHLYGDLRAAIVRQVTDPHSGVMPNWNVRLDPATIKAVAIYVHSLGGGE
ncbi:MAG TPA: cytochrome-c oxidase, cbb3-type subunit III [Acetobacteraceae bacterium]|nr:cytochrome-c oxidase, cbb3-type subunit III [Acetobacteraceae bacterium]